MMRVLKTDNAELPMPDRRQFLKVATTLGAGMTIALHLPAASATEGKTTADTFEPNAFIQIDKDSTVTVIIKHLEMGQGTFTGLATIVAEELDADWSQIKTVSAPADASRYNNLLFGPAQGTGGSTAIANSYNQMRVAGASAKVMLLAAAAKVWNVDPLTISVAKGIIEHKESGKTSSFGDLAALAAMQAVPKPEEVKLKDPSTFTLIGESVPRKDRGKTDGTAIYTQDIQFDGLLTALVAHPPAFGATVKKVDAKAAKASPGVVDVQQIPSGIVVLAKNFWSAKKGRDALVVEWDYSNALAKSSGELFEDFKKLASQPGAVAVNTGDTALAFVSADKVIEATYTFPYLAHAAMEPMNCVIKAKGDSCELWYGSQLQTMDQYTVSAILGIDPAKVTINTLLAGGSFGRRGNPKSDYVSEAAHIAKTQPGKAIKLVWTREDDTKAGHYRPMYLHKIKAGLDADGNITAWQQRIVGQSIAKGTAFEDFMVKDGVDSTSVEGAANLPYKIPSLMVDLHTVDLPVPVQWWRSVGHSHTAFSTETLFDELASAAGQDPVEFRMKLLEGHPRHQGVLKLAAEKAGWDKPLPKGRARGVAVHESFNSYVAEIAEVSLQKDGSVKVDRVVCAVDCGVAINPDVIKAQMEGGIGYGLSAALVSAITLEKGSVVESNFHNYQVLRLNQMPEVEVHIVPSAEPPTGVGEPGTPPIAPAVANAIASLTGKRLHDLPLKIEI